MNVLRALRVGARRSIRLYSSEIDKAAAAALLSSQPFRKAIRPSTERPENPDIAPEIPAPAPRTEGLAPWRATGPFSERPSPPPEFRSYKVTTTLPIVKTITEPLRILFCGSDDFSAEALRVLCKEMKEPTTKSNLIESIDVLCRPGKLSGRSMKNIREVPIKPVAQKLGLIVHERDTFTGWDLPIPYGGPINLIIAVSFGLLIPARILRSVKYGGINVHPSHLPQLRGPAPLQYTIMRGLHSSGVTVQTLHETEFDQGKFLRFSPHFLIPEKCTYPQLLEIVKPIGAKMLRSSILNLEFMEPHIEKSPIGHNPLKLIHSTKITTADKEIELHRKAERIEAKYRALGRLWIIICDSPTSSKRVLLDDIEAIPNLYLSPSAFKRFTTIRFKSKQEQGEGFIEQPYDRSKTTIFPGGPIWQSQKKFIRQKGEYRPGMPFKEPVIYYESGDSIIVPVQNGFVRIGSITVAGDSKKGAASTVMRRFEEEGNWIEVRKEYLGDNYARVILEEEERERKRLLEQMLLDEQMERRRSMEEGLEVEVKEYIPEKFQELIENEEREIRERDKGGVRKDEVVESK